MSRFLLRRPFVRDSDRSMLVARWVQRQVCLFHSGPVDYIKIDLLHKMSTLLRTILERFCTGNKIRLRISTEKMARINP